METSCPQCGRPMALELPIEADPADALRLSRFILCDVCSANRVKASTRPAPAFRSFAAMSCPAD